MSIVKIFQNIDEMSHNAADFICERAVLCVRERGFFTIALSGGSTPRRLYELLASSPYSETMQWEHIHIFWGDERCVPPDHPDSNYRLAGQSFLDRVSLPPGNIHRMKGEVVPHTRAAADFTLKSFTWTLPQIVTSLCLIRATDLSNSAMTDRSDATFRIVPQFLTLICPNGGESLLANDVCTVRWDADGVNTINIEYSVDSGLSWNLVRKNVPAAEKSFQWRPQGVKSMLCILRITDAENKELFDDSDGTFSINVLDGIDVEDALEFRVYQNSPNPFNASTTIAFTIPEAGNATVEIFNMRGQKVATLVDGYLDAGLHTVTWDAAQYSAGLYFYRISAGTRVHTEKMLFVK